MTPELQRYYEDRFDLFSQRGWIDLMEDVNGVALFAFERHTLDEVRQNEVLFKGSNNFIRPNFGDEVSCGGYGYRIIRCEFCISHD